MEAVSKGAAETAADSRPVDAAADSRPPLQVDANGEAALPSTPFGHGSVAGIPAAVSEQEHTAADPSSTSKDAEDRQAPDLASAAPVNATQRADGPGSRSAGAESTFERLLWASRLLVMVGVVVTVALAVGATVLATIDSIRFAGYLFAYMSDIDSSARIDAVTTIVKALDGFLIAALLIVVAIGLYELFIKPIEHATASPSRRRLHQIRDLEDLKQRVGKLVVLVLIGEFLQKALRLPVDQHLDLFYLGVGIALIAAALFLTNRADKGDADASAAKNVD